MLKKIIISVLILILVATGGVYFWLNSLKPSYKGEVEVSGTSAEVEVYYDSFGVPHIYASTETDAYYALGYVVAQDRLFQLEMIRRLASGRLSELLGKDLLKTDRFFRTIGLNRHADWSAKEFKKRAPENIQRSTQAYIDGVNQYIESGKTPIEYTLLGIEKEEFKIEDIFLISGYMAFGFAEGFRIDPMVESMYEIVGDTYMKEVDQNWTTKGRKIPVTGSIAKQATDFSQGISELIESFPVSPWIGSNSWVLAPKKSASGSTLLCNDTHMGYTQPAVWYEAHLEYPGFKFYGNHLAGFPFALTGHSDFCGNGLTMFENDDVDFYIEEVANNQVKFKDSLVSLISYKEVIHVKDQEDVSLQISETPHGPLIQDVFDDLPARKKEISVWWSYLKFPARSIEAVYNLNHAKSIHDARAAVALIDAPGLNVMYGDKDGHIAWWAAARLVERPEGQNPHRFLDGASGKDEPIRWLPFEQNPMSEDPESGLVYSANNQPDSISIGYYPGYYVPDFRANRIVELLTEKQKYSPDDMKKIMTDSKSLSDLEMARNLLSALEKEDPQAIRTEEANRLSSWEGDYGMESQGALILNVWVYQILHDMMVNKLGKRLFGQYMNSHFMKVSSPYMLRRLESVWWDDWASREKEHRGIIIKRAWKTTITKLRSIYGKDASKWRWSRAHQLEHVHPIGRKKPFNVLFNVGPEPIPGGNEVLNNMGCRLDSSSSFTVQFGPAMRRIIDFSDTEHSFSVLPTGQSGYFMADHYADQKDLFNNNIFRAQLMDEKEIKRQAGQALRLIPKK